MKKLTILCTFSKLVDLGAIKLLKNWNAEIKKMWNAYKTVTVTVLTTLAEATRRWPVINLQVEGLSGKINNNLTYLLLLLLTWWILMASSQSWLWID